jgi:hypothetical protein
MIKTLPIDPVFLPYRDNIILVSNIGDILYKHESKKRISNMYNQ